MCLSMVLLLGQARIGLVKEASWSWTRLSRILIGVMQRRVKGCGIAESVDLQPSSAGSRVGPIGGQNRTRTNNYIRRGFSLKNWSYFACPPISGSTADTEPILYGALI